MAQTRKADTYPPLHASHNHMRGHSDELRRNTRLLITLVIATNVLGNLSLSEGMQQVGRTVTFSILPYLQALLNRWVIAGVILLAVWLLGQLFLLSWADLSYVLPVTSISYVITAILGEFVMGDRITQVRWIGILLIMTGAIVVGRTRPRTTPEHEQDLRGPEEP